MTPLHVVSRQGKRGDYMWEVSMEPVAELPLQTPGKKCTSMCKWYLPIAGSNSWNLQLNLPTMRYVGDVWWEKQNCHWGLSQRSRGWSSGSEAETQKHELELVGGRRKSAVVEPGHMEGPLELGDLPTPIADQHFYPLQFPHSQS